MVVIHLSRVRITASELNSINFSQTYTEIPILLLIGIFFASYIFIELNLASVNKMRTIHFPIRILALTEH